MFLIFSALVFQALVTFFIKDFLIEVQTYGFFLVAINFLLVSFYLLRTLKKEWLLLIYTGFIFRILIMLVDLYVPFINIFSSGSDTEYFHTASINIANGFLPLSEGRTYYVTILSGFYYMFGDQRILAQLLNIILWVFSAVYLLKTISLFEIRNKVRLVIMVVFVLLPNSMFMSSILLRESIIVFFITISLFHFFKWMLNREVKHYVMALILSLPAMIFHAGMVGFLFAYLIAFFVVAKQKDDKKKNGKAMYVLLATVVILILFTNEDLFLAKFTSLQEEGIESINLSNNGGSAYLQSFNGLSSWKVFLLTPLKMIYFLFSPLPTDWRGFSDIASFLFDSFLYLFLIASIIIGVFKSTLDRKIKTVILLTLLITVFIYAYGTGNAGTAMRHRNKILPLVLIAYGLFSIRVKNYIRNAD